MSSTSAPSTSEPARSRLALSDKDDPRAGTPAIAASRAWREVRVQRHVRTAGPPHRQQRAQHPDAALQAQPDRRLQADAALGQHPGQPGGALAHLGHRHRAGAVDHPRAGRRSSVRTSTGWSVGRPRHRRRPDCARRPAPGSAPATAATARSPGCPARPPRAPAAGPGSPGTGRPTARRTGRCCTPAPAWWPSRSELSTYMVRSSFAVPVNSAQLLRREPGQVQRRRGQRLVAEQHLHQRRVRQRAIRRELLDQLLERQLLVRDRLHGGVADPGRPARRNVGSPASEVRSATVLVNMPTIGSSSTCVRPLTGVPISRSVWRA